LLSDNRDDYLNKISHANFVLSSEGIIDIYKIMTSLFLSLQKVELLPWKITNILNKYIDDLAKMKLQLSEDDPVDSQLLPCFLKAASSLSTGFLHHGVPIFLHQKPLMSRGTLLVIDNNSISELGDSRGMAKDAVAATSWKLCSFLDKLLNNLNYAFSLPQIGKTQLMNGLPLWEKYLIQAPAQLN
jgi:hypothetical protein